MTAAYLLRRKDSEKVTLPRPIKEGEQEAVFKKELLNALAKEDFLEDGGKIGYPCTHMYTNKEVYPGKADSETPLTKKTASKLKGKDLMIASAAIACGLNVYLQPYLSHECQGDLEDLRLQRYPKKRKCPKYMSEDDVESFFDGDRKKDEPGACEMFGLDPSKDADIWLRPYHIAAKQATGSTDNYNFEGYFGNEASYTTFYVYAVLFIEVPEYSEDRGKK